MIKRALSTWDKHRLRFFNEFGETAYRYRRAKNARIGAADVRVFLSVALVSLENYCDKDEVYKARDLVDRAVEIIDRNGVSEIISGASALLCIDLAQSTQTYSDLVDYLSYLQIAPR